MSVSTQDAPAEATEALSPVPAETEADEAAPDSLQDEPEVTEGPEEPEEPAAVQDAEEAEEEPRA